ncbi:Maf family nucleotide pyrophosphatase [Duncaniella muris]|uniref:Maf family nucleotide pyrophosphatase n=1 Tax=Duncaniella muris TaxID=2094150 RepID=UPI00272C2D86|nr:Maf family nucleotide pyrophosphatase [Duncaniella muris]
MFHPLDNLSGYEVILASGSPRRRELLEMLDVNFRVDTSHPVDEIVPDGTPAEEVPVYLSRLKASAYPLAPGEKKVVITADTVVIIDGKVLGKPVDEADACRMITLMQGREQKVVTGVTVRTPDLCQTFSAESVVDFAPLAADEIAYYVAKYKPFDKAGAYGIQEWIGAAGIKGISGSFYNVMGLPVQRLYSVLKVIV